MHVTSLLQKCFSESLSHQKRFESLSCAVQGILAGAKITGASIGRHLPGNAKQRNKIKRCDRLQSNPHLYTEKNALYRAMTNLLIGKQRRPVISIDWSSTNKSKKFHILRASLSLNGRGLVIYQKIYPEKLLNSVKAHQQFLRELETIIPPSASTPIILTDAGFRSCWVKALQSMNWDFITRVRGNSLYHQGDEDWQSISKLYKQATTKSQVIKNFHHTKSHKMKLRAVLVKEKSKGRHKITPRGLRNKATASLKNAKRESEPCLLLTSLSNPI